MRFGSGMIGGGFSIIFRIIIIVVVYFLFKEYSKNNHKIDEDSPEEIARQRCAKGEISKEELKEILDNLNGKKIYFCNSISPVTSLSSMISADNTKISKTKTVIKPNFFLILIFLPLYLKMSSLSH